MLCCVILQEYLCKGQHTEVKYFFFSVQVSVFLVQININLIVSSTDLVFCCIRADFCFQFIFFLHLHIVLFIFFLSDFSECATWCICLCKHHEVEVAASIDQRILVCLAVGVTCLHNSTVDIAPSSPHP